MYFLLNIAYPASIRILKKLKDKIEVKRTLKLTTKEYIKNLSAENLLNTTSGILVNLNVDRNALQ